MPATSQFKYVDQIELEMAKPLLHFHSRNAYSGASHDN